MAIVLYMNLFTILQFVLIYGAIFVPFVIHELTLGRQFYKTIPQMRHPNTLASVYRSVQILQLRIINEFVGIYIFPSQSIATLLFVSSSFLVIRNRDSLHTITLMIMLCWAVIGPSLWLICLVIGGYLHSKGKGILSSWKNHNWDNTLTTRREMEKFRISCTPIMISFGKTYTMNKASMLVFVRGLIRGLKKILLSLRKFWN